jgi:D-alanyl-lipoteichoic acid acyltransferase DltB (MBOAT superfamily)
LVAGPIVRAKDFLPQIKNVTFPSKEEINKGAYLVVKGLIKKAIIADYLAQYADLIFANPVGYSGFENLIAMYAYTIQIYCDFSGYTDMALGLAAIMGYKLCENFNAPYTAADITDFWRRWHISLSTWLRDYVYIPLGGNRNGETKQSLNLLITMLLGGLWHGANWKCVIWGALHGLALVFHKYWVRWTKPLNIPNFSWLKWAGVVLTFHFVAMLWVYFRASDLESANAMLLQIVQDTDVVSFLPPFLNTRPLVIFVLCIGIALHFFPTLWKSSIQSWFERSPWFLKWIAFLIVVQVILQFADQDVQPFIYFQF